VFAAGSMQRQQGATGVDRERGGAPQIMRVSYRCQLADGTPDLTVGLATANRLCPTGWAWISMPLATCRDSVLEEAAVPREAEVYLCGPAAFMTDMKAELAGYGVPPEQIHIEIFTGGESRSPGVVGAQHEIRIHSRTIPTAGHWSRLREAASPPTGTHRSTRAFWNWPKRATYRSAGCAGTVCVTTVRAVWFRERWLTDRNRSANPQKTTFWFAAH